MKSHKSSLKKQIPRPMLPLVTDQLIWDVVNVHMAKPLARSHSDLAKSMGIYCLLGKVPKLLYRLKQDSFFRNYGEIGYIVNNKIMRDRVVNCSGALFLEALTREARSFADIKSEISAQYADVPPSLEDDLRDFYSIMEQDGLIVSGETEDEVNLADKHFSYESIDPSSMENKEFTKIVRAKMSSQQVMSDYFMKHPQLMSLQIEITTHCNERCVHCYIPHTQKIKEMELSTIQTVLKQANEMGLLNLTLSGGEPLLHSQFCEILDIASNYDFSISIMSNLTVLNEKMIKAIKNAHVSSISVSLYSMHPEVHDSITMMKGSFYKTKKAIETLIANDVLVQINCPVMKENKGDIDDVLIWAAEHRIRAITDTVMMARYDGSVDNLDHRLALEEVEPIVRSVLDKDIRYRNHVKRKKQESTIIRNCDDGLCGVCNSSMALTVDGHFCPCAGWQSLDLGSIYKSTLKDIWSFSPNVLFIRGLRMKDFPDCLECQDGEYCSVCMARNANESPTGDPLEINRHFCKVAHLNHSIVEDWLEEEIR